MELITVFLVLVFVGISAIFSGLNIALLSLNLPELRRQAKIGSRRARAVYPLRKNTHLTLTAILIANVAAASATALYLGRHAGSGLVAGAISTFLLVIFGELLPQALFAKQALRICAFFAPLIRLVIFVTYPVSKPLQLTLDKLIGEHDDSLLHSRRELGMIITDHVGADKSELDDDEVEIVRNALQLSEKQVSDIMTEIDDVYWLTPDTVIDGARIEEIKAAHYSRVPIFDKRLRTFYGSIRMKDLVDIDFDESPQRIDSLKLHSVEPVGSRTALDTMFRTFISARSHLIPIKKDRTIVGIVTIEDLLEEIIGHEIIDESDHQLNRT